MFELLKIPHPHPPELTQSLYGLQVDKFLYSNEEYIKAGALMAVGVLHCGVRNECDPALALLSDYLENKPKDLRIAAIVGYFLFLIAGIVGYVFF